MKKLTKSSISIDFTGVESGGGAQRKVPNGEYLLKISEVEQKESQAGNDYLSIKYKVANGPLAGAAVWDNVSLKNTALWRLRTLLELIGMNPSDGKFELDLPKMVGKTVFVEIANETYQGKEKPRVANLLAGGSADTGSKPTSSAPGFKRNDLVTFKSDEGTQKGRIVSTSGNTANVEVDGDEWEIEFSELTIATE